MEKLDRVYVVFQRTLTKDGCALYIPEFASRNYEIASKHRDLWEKLQENGHLSQYLYSTYVIKTQNDVEKVDNYVKINGYKNKIEFADGKQKETFLENIDEYLTEYSGPDKNNIFGLVR